MLVLYKELHIETYDWQFFGDWAPPRPLAWPWLSYPKVEVQEQPQFHAMTIFRGSCSTCTLGASGARDLRRGAGHWKNCRLYVQICSFWHKTSIQSLIFHPICPNALTKNFIWSGPVGARPLTGGGGLPLEPPMTWQYSDLHDFENRKKET